LANPSAVLDQWRSLRLSAVSRESHRSLPAAAKCFRRILYPAPDPRQHCPSATFRELDLCNIRDNRRLPEFHQTISQFPASATRSYPVLRPEGEPSNHGRRSPAPLHHPEPAHPREHFRGLTSPKSSSRDCVWSLSAV